jgi:hypothetical protein
MPNGKLGSAALVAATNTTVYTVPGTVSFAIVSLNLCNKGVVDSAIRIAISTSNNPLDNDYIEYDALVESSAGGVGNVLERTGIFMSSGEKVVAYSNNANMIVRVHGVEENV